MAQRVCPWWMGFALLLPLRRLVNNPEKILRPYIKEGMRVLEIGPGMGFFSLPLAKMVGLTGKVFCVDLQERMLNNLKRRAQNTNLSAIIEARLCSKYSLGIDDLEGQIDFVLAFAVMHEVPEIEEMLGQINMAMAQGARFLIAEPTIHVKKKDFQEMVSIALKNGFIIKEEPRIKGASSVLLSKV